MTRPEMLDGKSLEGHCLKHTVKLDSPFMDAKQFCLFCLVGVLNTLIDFGLYNLLTRRVFNFSRVKANLISTSVAMAFSFIVNLQFVFAQHQVTLLMERMIRFVLVTCFSAYILQNAVIYFTSQIWPAPVRIVNSITTRLWFAKSLNQEFISKNTAKIFAVLLGLLWNYLWYKFYVYAET